MTRYRLSEIYIYPIKSLAGVRMKSARVQEKGLEGDRRMMLIDENNQFITQRALPKMALFHVEWNEGLVTVSHKIKTDLHRITIDPTAPINSEHFKAMIWDDEVQVQEIAAIYSKWFSDALEFNCRLVAFPEMNKRQVDVKYVPQESNVSLADGYPFLVIGKESLRDVSERVGVELPIRRFRPNFFFEGGMPYDEDTWQDFYIGSVKFRGVKPCARCVLITIDPNTGEKGVEPLKTLSSYRNKNGKVYFGQNVIALQFGIINEGDDIVQAPD